MSEESETAESLVGHIALPHVRGAAQRGEITDPDPEIVAKATERLVAYCGKLRALGMADGDIQGLFFDLYWDAHEIFASDQKRAADKRELTQES